MQLARYVDGSCSTATKVNFRFYRHNYFLIFLILSSVQCGRKDLGDQETQILYKAQISTEELGELWPKSVQKNIKNYRPEFEDVSLYDYGGIQIVIGNAVFDSTDIAFGFERLLVAEPRNIFEDGVWYRPPFVVGRKSEQVSFAFSPNQVSFFSPIVQKEISRRLGRDNEKKAELSWHKEVLPRSNMYRDSERFFPEIKVFDVPLLNAYSAKYQSKESIAHIYVAHFQNEKFSHDSCRAILNEIARLKKNPTALPQRFTATDRGTWWTNANGTIDGILCHRWLVIYFERFANTEFLERAVQETFSQMHQVRKRALRER